MFSKAVEIADPQEIPLMLAVNGAVRQKSNTSDMIFPLAEIVSHLSQFMTLLPGDVVAIGTPEGVGAGMKPPKFLERGDIVGLAGGVLAYSGSGSSDERGETMQGNEAGCSWLETRHITIRPPAVSA